MCLNGCKVQALLRGNVVAPPSQAPLARAQEYVDAANLGTLGASRMFACGRHAHLCIARTYYRQALRLPPEV